MTDHKTALSVLAELSPTTEDVMNESSSFSPRRWKTGWPHHLGHVPPYKDDAFASLTRGDVYQFAADATASGYNRDAVIDFIGAAFAFGAGKSPQTQLKLQQFLRNKGQAQQLLQALRSLDGLDPVAQFARVRATGLPGRYASILVYFLAGPQSGDQPGPVIVSDAAAEALGVSSSEWDAEAYGDYLAALTAVRDEWDSSAPLDAVEYALSRS
ncbi:8-oxoguanine DNA glycosylase OGG fold protein [Corynebacterium sanguinis]|uniref:Uncharacterized protein n=1 Tax=Corynebacterium sanguinis TaxID=2594913 RepID=A0A838WWM2_9CORY|nr:hypothetical protein [Corynebacterium sanguinis]MBA4506144.1 hypothetical protein [Corynebacterium sanguinis]MCT1411264.1 hypothetical protein [Corynebacterium sanguinis]MCT1493116.1 hypothetical protein [Corynebacterium sanguinis]MCT1499895.1 hypothetical protein [Corynebacterium sanguinis]MCT1694732.1 hypothetical protein [Corynebacterium sanguinis]